MREREREFVGEIVCCLLKTIIMSIIILLNCVANSLFIYSPVAASSSTVNCFECVREKGNAIHFSSSSSYQSINIRKSIEQPYFSPLFHSFDVCDLFATRTHRRTCCAKGRKTKKKKKCNDSRRLISYSVRNVYRGACAKRRSNEQVTVFEF